MQPLAFVQDFISGYDLVRSTSVFETLPQHVVVIYHKLL